VEEEVLSSEASKAGTAPAMSIRGRVEQVRYGIVVGWAIDDARPDQALLMEILVDGTVVATTEARLFRRDLKAKGIGEGCHGFWCRLPDAVFDGRDHMLTVRPMGGEVLRPGPMPFQAAPADGARLGLVHLHVQDGRLTGRLRATVPENDRMDLPLEIRCDGDVLGSLWVSRADLADSDATGKSGRFILPLAEGDAARLWTGDLALYLGHGVGAVRLDTGDGHPLRGAVTVAFAEVSHTLVTASLHFPFQPAGLPPLHLLVDGVVAQRLSLGPARRAKADTATAERWTVPVTVPMPADLTVSLHRIAIGFDTGGTLGGAEGECSFLPPGRMERNGRFTAWTGDVPAGWRLPAALADRAAPASADRGGLAFDLAETGSPLPLPLPLLEQDLGHRRLPAGTRLESLLSARASEATKLLLRVAIDQGGAGNLLLDLPLTATPAGAVTGADHLLPDEDGVDGTVTIQLLLTGRPPERLVVDQIGLGPFGFPRQIEDSAGEAEEADRSQPANAVVNGGFNRWPHGLRFAAGPGETPLALGWSLFIPGQQGRADVVADRIRTRSLPHGDPGSHTHGLLVTSHAEGVRLRLEAELVLSALDPRRDAELCFHAGLGDGPSRTGGRITQVLAVVRPDDAAPGEREQTVELAGDLWLDGVGQRFNLAIPAWRIARLHQIMPVDQGCRLLLAFVLDKGTDVRLADVRLTPRAETPAAPAPTGYLRFEDRAIVNQLPLLKGLEGWSAPQVVRATPPAPPATGGGGRWAWARPGLPSVEVVICVYNALDDVLACLAALERHTTIPHIVRLVDDGSDAITAAALARHAASRPWVDLVTLPQNMGYTRAANAGMSRVRGDWLVLLNSDTIVTEGWLEGLFECALSDERIRFVGPVSNAASWQSVPDLKNAAGKWSVNPLPPGQTPDGVAALVRGLSRRLFPRVPLLNGFCTLIHRQTLAELGFLDEIAFPVGYGEENDLCLRAGAAGWQLAVADHVYVYHRKSASFGSQRRDQLAKAGTEALLAKHPAVDMAAVQRQLAECLPLITLRDMLKNALQAENAAPPPAAPTAAETAA